MQHTRLKHVQDLERFQTEANAKALHCLGAKAACREEMYKDHALGVGDLVLRRAPDATKLHPRWDKPFIVHNLTDRNTYQLRTCNGYVLCTLYNAEQLKR